MWKLVALLLCVILALSIVLYVVYKYIIHIRETFVGIIILRCIPDIKWLKSHGKVKELALFLSTDKGVDLNSEKREQALNKVGSAFLRKFEDKKSIDCLYAQLQRTKNEHAASRILMLLLSRSKTFALDVVHQKWKKDSAHFSRFQSAFVSLLNSQDSWVCYRFFRKDIYGLLKICDAKTKKAIISRWSRTAEHRYSDGDHIKNLFSLYLRNDESIRDMIASALDNLIAHGSRNSFHEIMDIVDKKQLTYPKVFDADRLKAITLRLDDQIKDLDTQPNDQELFVKCILNIYLQSEGEVKKTALHTLKYVFANKRDITLPLLMLDLINEKGLKLSEIFDMSMINVMETRLENAQKEDSNEFFRKRSNELLHKMRQNQGEVTIRTRR